MRVIVGIVGKPTAEMLPRLKNHDLHIPGTGLPCQMRRDGGATEAAADDCHCHTRFDLGHGMLLVLITAQDCDTFKAGR